MSMLILTAGNFGTAVAARIAAKRAAEVCALTTPIERIAALLPAHDFVAVAAWRPYVELCRALDQACHDQGKRWSLVEISGNTMTCGPLTVPGAGRGCYGCFVARVDAHQRAGDRPRALRQAYARNPQLGPLGHTPAMVAIAVAALLQDADQADAGGRFRRVDVLTGTVLETELIPLHDCPRCRPRPPGEDPTRRFLDAMLPEIERLTP